MGFTLYNTQNNNQVTLVNTDPNNPLEYTFLILNSSTVFVPALSYPSTPTVVLAAGATLVMDMSLDGIYQLVIAGSPNTSYYFLLGANIRLCERKMIRKFLCDPHDCDYPTVLHSIYKITKFNDIKNALYFIYNQWVQTQSVTDLIAPPNNDLASMQQWLTELQTICEECGCHKENRESPEITPVYPYIYPMDRDRRDGGCGCR